MRDLAKTLLDRTLLADRLYVMLDRWWFLALAGAGTGFVATTVTWIQGALAQFGFAGYVICALVIALLVITLIKSVAKAKNGDKSPAPTISLDAAGAAYASCFGSPDQHAALDSILQLAADGKIIIYASRIRKDPAEYDLGVYAPRQKLSLDQLGDMHVDHFKSSSVYTKIHGQSILVNGSGERFGMVYVNARTLVNTMPAFR